MFLTKNNEVNFIFSSKYGKAMKKDYLRGT